MKLLATFFAALAFGSATATEYRPLETTEQARQRQSAENHQRYENSDNRLIPPTYQQPLGSPTVQGVDRPGYAPQPTYQPATDWRDRAKR